ncbi:MAG: cytochrome C assembly protein, partial [Armatimonadota bacterium]
MNTVGILATVSWIAAAVAYTAGRRARLAADALMVVGTLLGALVIVALWSSLDRPPLRTLGETR